MAVTRQCDVIELTSQGDYAEGPLLIKGVAFAGAAAGGDEIVITAADNATDSTGNTLFHLTAVLGATVPITFARPVMTCSVFLKTLDSGSVLIYVE